MTATAEPSSSSRRLAPRLRLVIVPPYHFGLVAPSPAAQPVLRPTDNRAATGRERFSSCRGPHQEVVHLDPDLTL
jgi:hypothetical protein